MNDVFTANATGPGQQVRGGKFHLTARGTFGGGTIKAQWCESNSATSSDWIDVKDAISGNTAALTATGMLNFEVGAGWLRLVMSGSSGTYNAGAQIKSISTNTVAA